MDLLSFFNTSETPFMLLFVILFFYVIKTNKEREARQQATIDQELKKMNEGLTVLMGVWKILLEKEVKKNEHDRSTID